MYIFLSSRDSTRQSSILSQPAIFKSDDSIANRQMCTPVWENKTKGFKSAKSTVSRDILCRYGSTRNNLLTLYIVDVSRLH